MSHMLSAEELKQAWSRELSHHFANLATHVSRETGNQDIPQEQLLAILDESEVWQKLEIHCMRILEANKAFNLVSRRSPEAQIRDNALDGLILGCALHRVSRETGKLLLLDAGSGSGVPGVPAMFVIETFVPQSQHRLLMIDSHRMKQEFLCDLIDLFDSGKAQVFRGRLENPVLSGLCKEFGPDHHWILSSKALARLDKTLKWIRNLGPDLDELLLVKGPAVLDEIDKGLIEKEGLELRGLYRFNSSLRNTYLLRLTRR